MGNSYGSRRSGPGMTFGSPAFHMMYGGRVHGVRRSLPSLSNRSSGQVEDAKQKFIHCVFETDFDFMPDSAKLKLQIFAHMTKDARVTVRDYVKSMNATSVFRASQQLQRQQNSSNRIFVGHCTLTKATKEYILEHKPEVVRELFVVEELALSTFLCFAGVPQCDASGWILDDIESTEFVSIADISQYLTQKAAVWKTPKHCTAYAEFAGKTPKNLQKQLKQRNEEAAVNGKQTARNKKTPFTAAAAAAAKNKNPIALATKKQTKLAMKQMVSDEDESSEDEVDDDIEILNETNIHNHNHNDKHSVEANSVSRKRPKPPTTTDFCHDSGMKKRKLDDQ